MHQNSPRDSNQCNRYRETEQKKKEINFQQRYNGRNHSVPAEQGWVWSSLLSLVVPPMVFLFFTVSLYFLSTFVSDRLLDLLPHPKQPIKSNSLGCFVWSLLLYTTFFPRRRIRNTDQQKKRLKNREEWRIAKRKGRERGRKKRGSFSDKQRKLNSFVFLIYLLIR